MKKIQLILIMVLFMMGIQNVYAASSYSVSSSARSVTVGKTVTVTISGSNVTGGFMVSSSNPAVMSIASSDSRKWIENNSESLSLKALKAGSTTITVTPISLSDNNGTDLSLGAKTVTITVSDPVPVVKSKNCNLSSLTVDGYTLTPVFSKDTLEYSVELESDTTKAVVGATAEDATAAVSGTGEIAVNDGANIIKVYVTAANGDTKTYTINANVLVKNPIEIVLNKKKYNVIRKASELPELSLYELSTVKIKDEDVVSYFNKKTGINLIGLKDSDGKIDLYVYDSKNNTYDLYKELNFNKIVFSSFNKDNTVKIPNGYKETAIKINDSKVTAWKLNNDSKYSLVYGMNVETGKKNLYLYDSKENTLQIYYDEEVNSINEIKNIYFYSIIGLGIIVLTLSAIIIVPKFKKNTKKKNKLD